MSTLIYPVILAGGSGTRLWPRSREKHPKQFMHLIDGKSLFQLTCARFSDRAKFAAPTIITQEDHRFLVRDQLLQLGITDAYILTEPLLKNTLAACLSCALFIEQKHGNVPIMFTPSDHIIENESVLFEAIEGALPYVLGGSISIFGIEPLYPHTGYGYILKDQELFKGIFKPKLFTEKPSEERAKELIQEGGLWNSGMYFSTPVTLKKEAKIYTKNTYTILKNFYSVQHEHIKGFFAIPTETYTLLESLSLDTAITEKTTRGIVVHTPIIWSDLGSWSSLYDHFEKTDKGNVIRGDSVVLDTENSYIESTSRLVTVVGLRNTGVIETPDAILVFPLNQSEGIKQIVKQLSEKKRSEVSTHRTVHRPWGNYQILGGDTTYQSKKITVLPGAELSLQRHKHRAEHWIVIEGVATVTCDNRIFELRKNESTFLPLGSIHRLQNKHSEVVSLIEVQTGDYFGEDDIERFEDTYGR